jgi:carboxypeptidase Q
LNITTVNDDGDATDTGPLYDNGVPTMTNLIKDNENHDNYYTYHHSAGDTMSIMNADDLDSNVVGIAAMFYILADL